ncbi:MAG: methionyl-tRNA formyltransferase, partial [Pseudomonadota bacterium]
LKNAESHQAFADLKADAAVVVAYGLLLPEPILTAPRFGCLNVHASDLPRWRGAAPIHRAIMAGDESTAVCIMQMERGLDTGPVLARKHVAIDDTITTGALQDVLKIEGASLLVETLGNLAAGPVAATPQPQDGVSYAAKISKSETEIDFSQSAVDVHNHIRGLAPTPGAWFLARTSDTGTRVKVLQSEVIADLAADIGAPASVIPGTLVDDAALTVACGSGAVRLATVQRAGSKPCDGQAFLNGTDFGIGDAITLGDAGQDA